MPFVSKNIRPDFFLWAISLLLCVFVQGCAVQYVDEETGTRHLFGFGHMKIRVSDASEGVRSVATGVETLGISTTFGSEYNQFALGYNNFFNLKVADDSAVRLDWPDDDPFHIHVGTIPPWEVQIIGTSQQYQHEKGEKGK